MDDVKTEFDRHERGVCGKRRVADGDFCIRVCKAAGTKYAARSTVNSGEDGHKSSLLLWLHASNGRNIRTEFK